jgi:hypothetical protein
MDLPRRVLDAKQIDFGWPVTGYLCLVELQPPCLLGVIFCDALKRFEDGAYIRTSALARVFQSENYLLFETFSGSRYVVCDWLDDSGAVEAIRVFH